MKITGRTLIVFFLIGSFCNALPFRTIRVWAAPPKSAKLTIQIKGLRNENGKVYVNLWSSNEGFPNKEAKAFRRATVVIHGSTAMVDFADVPFGTYAVSSYHDENGNGRFDTRFPGIPTEGYGISNGDRGKLGPPPYEPAQFMVRELEQTVVVEMMY